MRAVTVNRLRLFHLIDHSPDDQASFYMLKSHSAGCSAIFSCSAVQTSRLISVLLRFTRSCRGKGIMSVRKLFKQDYQHHTADTARQTGVAPGLWS